MIPTQQVEKIIVNQQGQATSVVVKDATQKLPLVATLIRKRDPKGGGKITKLPAGTQVKVLPIRKSERRPKAATNEEEDAAESSKLSGKLISFLESYIIILSFSIK